VAAAAFCSVLDRLM